MSEQPNPWRNPFQTLFRACLLVLGATIALNLAVGYLRPILPWLVGTGALVAVAWVVIAIVRWRRSQW